MQWKKLIRDGARNILTCGRLLSVQLYKMWFNVGYSNTCIFYFCLCLSLQVEIYMSQSLFITTDRNIHVTVDK
jgi:hypothetical protein